MVKFIYKWNGIPWGFIYDGNLFNNNNEYIGWVEDENVFMKNGIFLGEIIEDVYILRSTYTSSKTPKEFKHEYTIPPKQSVQSLIAIKPILPVGKFDALESYDNRSNSIYSEIKSFASKQ